MIEIPKILWVSSIYSISVSVILVCSSSICYKSYYIFYWYYDMLHYIFELYDVVHHLYYIIPYTYTYIGDYNIATFIDHCQAQDPMIQVAEEYIFAARASLMLRGNNTVILL